MIAAPVPARVQLTHAHFAKCSKTLAPGELKRCMQRGPLISFYIGCPTCGFIATYLHSDVGYVETPVDPLVFPKVLRGMTNPPRCYGCKLTIDVVAEGDDIFLVTRDPNAPAPALDPDEAELAAEDAEDEARRRIDRARREAV